MTAQISTVKFLRNLAESFGGLKTVRGRGLHRATAHVIRMDEELQRQAALALMDNGDPTDQSAQNIYHQACEEMRQKGQPVPPPWAQAPEETRDMFRRYWKAAVGAPVYERPVHADDD